MTKIYINNVLQKVEVLPSNTPTKDETLETFSFALMSNTSALPLAPMQKVKVDFKGDGSEIVYFYVVSDSVETISLSPLRYKHSISCIQNTRELSKHMVRNSTFTDVVNNFKHSHNALSQYNYSEWAAGVDAIWDNTLSPGLNFYSRPLTLGSNERPLVSAKLKISTQVVYGDPRVHNSNGLIQDAHTLSDIEEVTGFENLSLISKLLLKYTNANLESEQIEIYPSDFGETEFDLNKVYNFPIVNQKIAEGCNNFEILFYSHEFIGGGTSNSDTSYLNNFLVYYMVQVQILLDKTSGYSCYDILDLLLKRQAKETSLRSEKPLFVLPQDNNNFTENQRELARLLKNTIAPNFTFTDLTMYECVAEVFRIFDAIFNMDENRVLGIEFFNDLSGENITAKAKFTGRTLALGEDKYTNGLVANYQDARIIESFPRKEGEFAHLRSAEFGVPEQQDHKFIVPHNIFYITKCEIVVDSFRLAIPNPNFGTTYFTINNNLILDITNFIFEKTIWSTLDEGNPDYYNHKPSQANTLFYEQGNNQIECAYTYKNSWGGTRHALPNLIATVLLSMSAMSSDQSIRPLGTLESPTDWKNVLMRTIYICSVDGKAKVHSLTNKYPGETIIDQANGAVDLNKFGLNMLGLSMKLGNPTLNATHKITSWADRIKIGQVYEWAAKDPITGEIKTSLWVANVVNYTFMNGKVQGKVSFVQNFNALALRTQLLRQKRMSNISRELVQKSEEILTDFVYFSSVPFQGSSQRGEKIHFNPLIFQYLLWDSLAATPETTFKVGDSFVHFNEITTENNEDTLKMYYIPLVKYGAGNTINFEMAYDHPMSAGNQTKASAPNWLGISNYFTKYVKYTDDEGYRNEFNIRVPVATHPYTQDFPIATMTINYVEGTDQEDENDNVIDIKGFMAYKQPNEIFALNYQLAFLPLPGRENLDFIGNEFINNNRFVKDDDIIQNARYIVFKEEKSSNLDIKATPYFLKREITDYIRSQSQVDTNACSIRFNYQQIGALNYTRVKSWALVDERDNVLFASNSFTFAIRTHAVIYFVTKLMRIN